MLVNHSVSEFVEIVASDAPAPGGGSVAALAGAMAAGLVVMVCNLTLGRSKFAQVEQELQVVKNRAEGLKQQLLELVDKDTESFNQVMAAYKLPKGDEEAKRIRGEAVEAASKGAAQVPLATAEFCLQVLQMTEVLAERANPNAITDIGVAAKMAETGLQGAVYNVLINLGSIKDEVFAAAAKRKSQEWLSQSAGVLARVQSKVESNL